MTPPTTDTSRKADRPYDEQYDTLQDIEQDPTGAMMAIRDLVAERDAAILREKSLKDNTEELRQLQREFNAVKRERDDLRAELAAARNEALEEAAQVAESRVHSGTGKSAAIHIRALKSTPAPQEITDIVLDDGFPEGWYVQDRPADNEALLCRRSDFAVYGGAVCICTRPRSTPTDVWLETARIIARGFDQANGTPRENCPECKGSGMRDSGGVQPWGEPIDVPCDCENAPCDVTPQEAEL